MLACTREANDVSITETDKTKVTQLEYTINKLERLLEFVPGFTQMGYVSRLRELAPQVAAGEQTSEGVQKSFGFAPPWHVIAISIDDVCNKLQLLAAPLKLFIASESSDRAICTPEPCYGTDQAEVDDFEIAAAAAEIATAIAKGVAAAIPAEILGESNPAHTAAEVIAAALEVVAKTLELTVAILQKDATEKTTCKLESFEEVVYSMCGTENEIKINLDLLSKKVDYVDRKINILLNLEVQLTALAEKILNLEVERQLSDCRALTSLYLPAAVGGMTDAIPGLIEKLRSDSLTAGIDTGAAESYLKQGVAAAVRKDYCKAWNWFCLAYRELAGAACCMGNHDRSG
jgi:hypothetical protein